MFVVFDCNIHANFNAPQHNRMDSIIKEQRRSKLKAIQYRIMQLFGDLDILSFVRTSRLNWTGNVNRMDSKKSQVFYNNPQGSRLGEGPKNRWWNIVQTDINKCKVINRKERSKNRADWEKCIRDLKDGI